MSFFAGIYIRWKFDAPGHGPARLATFTQALNPLMPGIRFLGPATLATIPPARNPISFSPIPLLFCIYLLIFELIFIYLLFHLVLALLVFHLVFKGQGFQLVFNPRPLHFVFKEKLFHFVINEDIVI
jgi:hypothetical protein